MIVRNRVLGAKRDEMEACIKRYRERGLFKTSEAETFAVCVQMQLRLMRSGSRHRPTRYGH
jgi:hypothetical protein